MMVAKRGAILPAGGLKGRKASLPTGTVRGAGTTTAGLGTTVAGNTG